MGIHSKAEEHAESIRAAIRAAYDDGYDLRYDPDAPGDIDLYFIDQSKDEYITTVRVLDAGWL